MKKILKKQAKSKTRLKNPITQKLKKLLQKVAEIKKKKTGIE